MSPLSRTVRVTSRSKVNLFLDIVGKRSDGYHDVDMIMQSLELGDELLIEDLGSSPPGSGILVDLTCDSPVVPVDATNLAVRAARAIASAAHLDRRLRIHLTKRIPVAAGLAGGSSDAAAVLIGIDRLFSLGYGPGDLERIGRALGADVPFCVRCGTARAQGIGDLMTSLRPLEQLHVVLVTPTIEVSTPWAYSAYDAEPQPRLDAGPIHSAIECGDVNGVAQNLQNAFYPIVSAKYPEVSEIRRFLLQCGVLGAMMSGSGPTVYAIARDAKEAGEVAGEVRGRYPSAFVCTTRSSSSMGVELC